MKKIYIITNSSFPFGNANSNYIRYFSLSLVSLGWDVYVIGSNMSDENPESGKYREIQYSNIQFPKNKIPFHIRDHFFYGKKLKAEMRRMQIEKEAYVFVYSMYMDLVKTVLEETKNLEKGHLSIGMVEWFQPFQYRYGKMNPDYCCWKYTFEKLVPLFGKVLPISRKLQEYYAGCGCCTMLLPIMADTNEHSKEDIRVDETGIRHFIYPGSATNKDSFKGMLDALSSLSDEELSRIRMHFTTLTQGQLLEFATDTQTWSRIASICVFHGFLPYTELLQLYKTMDFIFLSREKNIVTLSNFPSKIPELMCYAVVPVCSNVGDYAELYLHDNVDSVIFEGADSKGCLDGIRRALTLSNGQLLQMKKNARSCAENRFDYRNWAESISCFLES